MKKEIAVGGRYKSRIGEMFALEDAMEMKALRESGILESVEDSLRPQKVGCVTYIGTGGNVEVPTDEEIDKIKGIFKA